MSEAAESSSAAGTLAVDVADLTPQQAAAALGCSRALIYRLIGRGELPGTYELPGSRRKRIPQEDIAALKERQRVCTRSDHPPFEPFVSTPKANWSGSFADQPDAIERGEAP